MKRLMTIFLSGLFFAPSCGDSEDPVENDSEGDTASTGDTASDTEEKHPLENIAITKSTAISTVAVVEWPEDLGDVQAEDIKEAYVEFGLGDTFSKKVSVDVTAERMRTLLLGMKANHRTYGIRSTVVAGDKTYTSDVTEFETGYAPSDFPRVTQAYRHESYEVADGYVLTTTFSNPVYAFIVDSEGSPVWWTKGVEAGDSSGVGSSEAVLDWDGKYVYIIATNPDTLVSPIRRVSMDGETVEDFDAGRAHHSLAAVPEGGVVFVQREEEGSCDAIVHLTEDGGLAEIFNWKDSFEFRNECHTNFVGYEEVSDSFYISSRNYDIAAYVLRDTQADEQVVWAIGRDEYQTAVTEDFEMGNVGDITALHGLHAWNAGKTLLLFNNTTGNTSNIFEYEFNDDFSEAKTAWTFNKDGSGSTEAGGVQRLENGNTQITYSTDSVILQVAPDGTVVQRLEFGTPIGYSRWRESLYGPPRQL